MDTVEIDSRRDFALWLSNFTRFWPVFSFDVDPFSRRERIDQFATSISLEGHGETQDWVKSRHK
jgi:hypothetical protein